MHKFCDVEKKVSVGNISWEWKENIYSACAKATSAYKTSIELYLHTPALICHAWKSKFKELIRDKFILDAKFMYYNISSIYYRELRFCVS
jgi:hypothetical protein